MGKFILLLLSLFAIGCVLYGISAGVQIIQRGFSWLAESARDDASDNRPLVTPLPPGIGENTASPATQQTEANDAEAASQPLAPKSYVDELHSLFALHQSGALTREEFQRFKQHLLSEITTTMPPLHQKNHEAP